MRPEVIQFVGNVLNLWTGPVGTAIDIGSMDVNGTVRPEFEKRGWEYLGYDIEAGKNVDFVGNTDDLIFHFGAEKFEAVCSCETLEHLYDPIRAVESMRKILKPGGLLILSCAGNGFPEHRHPVDCWRPLPDALKWMLRGMKKAVLGEIVVPNGQGILAFGIKEG